MSSTLLSTLRRAAPVLLGVLLLSVGLFALHHLLKPVDAADVLANIRATPTPVLIAAILGTAIAYAALVGYDVLALQFIGRRLPWRVVSLGGFLAYAFGNTIGASVVSGGAVRYRIYSAVGLNAFEVATVSSYIGVALGVGLTLIGLAALAVYPGAVAGVLPLSEPMLRWSSAAVVLVSVAVILWISWGNRSMRLWKLELRLPSPRNLGGQLAVTLVDVVAAAFTLWVLMPEGTPDFSAFVAVYAIAMMVGILSHVPGGVGVFETVVISTLPPSVPVAEAAAALLLFRIIYYLLPFVLGFVLVSINELRMAGGAMGRLLGRGEGASRPVREAMHGMVPSIAALVAAGLGVYLLLASLVPAVRDDALEERDIVSTILLETGALGSAMMGVLLIILSHGLLRRIRAAYWLTIAALTAGAAISVLTGGIARPSVVVLTLATLLMLPFRQSFHRRAKLTDSLFSASWFVLVFAVVAAAVVFFFFVHRAPVLSGDVWTGVAQGTDAPRALRAALVGSGLLLVFSLYAVLRPVRVAPVSAFEPGARERFAALAAQTGDPRACLAQSGDKQFLFSDSGQAGLMFAVQGNSWIVLGDAIGRAEEAVELSWTLADLARRAGAEPVFYGIRPDRQKLYADMGHSLHLVGDEAVLDLPGFDEADPARAAVIARVQGWTEAGGTVELVLPPHAPALTDELRRISDAWLGGRMGRDKAFLTGRFDPDYLNRFPVALIRRQGRLIGFALIHAPGDRAQVAVDLLRYLPDEGEGLIEATFLMLARQFRARGAQKLSLGMAPPEGLAVRSVERLWNRFGSFIYRHGAAFRTFAALRALRDGFAPVWEPRFIAVPPALSPRQAMTDLAVLVAGGRGVLMGRAPGTLRRRSAQGKSPI